MAFAPRGSIVRTGRMTADVESSVGTVSGRPVIVTLHPTAESRRTFRRVLSAADCLAAAVEGDAYGEEDGTFNRRTGVRQRAESVVPHTFRVVGPLSGVRMVCGSPAVASWGFQVGVRVPLTSGGSGTASPAADKRIAAGRREGGERAADTERAAYRPSMPVDRQAEAVRAIAPGADADTTAAVAELVRLARRSAVLTAGERGRVILLRAALGL